MTPEHRLTVLKMTVLAIENPNSAANPIALACQFGDRLGVTSDEVKEVLKDPLLTTYGKVQGVNVPLLDPKTLRLSGMLLSGLGGTVYDKWDALADKIMCNLPRSSRANAMNYLYNLNVPFDLAEKIWTYVREVRGE